MRGFEEVSIYAFLVFILASYFIRFKLKKSGTIAFLLINLTFVLYIMCELHISNRTGLKYLLFYLFIFYIQYYLLSTFIFKKNYIAFIPILFPIFILFCAKFFPLTGYLKFFVLIGISYISFKATHLTILVRNKIIALPNLTEFYCYVLYAPTLFIGPINSAKDFFETLLQPPSRKNFPIFISLNRILVGLTKYFYFSAIINQLTFSGLWSDGYDHTWLDFFVSSVAFYLKLYMNFSGFCDIVIGISGLLCIKINENFDNPLLSRNIKDFWNRWHITLSHFMRDLVFNPMVKFLLGLQFIKQTYLNSIAAFTTIIIFLLIGLWHGLEWNYLIFGLLHGLGVVFIQYYNIFLTFILSKKIYQFYTKNSFVKIISTIITFCYISFTFFIFENDLASILDISAYLIEK